MKLKLENFNLKPQSVFNDTVMFLAPVNAELF